MFWNFDPLRGHYTFCTLKFNKLLENPKCFVVNIKCFKNFNVLTTIVAKGKQPFKSLAEKKTTTNNDKVVP